MFHFDFTRGIVIINPDKYQIHSYSIFELYVQLFAAHYGLEVTVKDLTLNWWAVSLSIVVPEAFEGDLLKGKPSKIFDSTELITEKDSVRIEADIVVSPNHPALDVGELQGFFTHINEVVGKSSTSTKKSAS